MAIPEFRIYPHQALLRQRVVSLADAGSLPGLVCDFVAGYAELVEHEGYRQTCWAVCAATSALARQSAVSAQVTEHFIEFTAKALSFEDGPFEDVPPDDLEFGSSVCLVSQMLLPYWMRGYFADSLFDAIDMSLKPVSGLVARTDPDSEVEARRGLLSRHHALWERVVRLALDGDDAGARREALDYLEVLKEETRPLKRRYREILADARYRDRPWYAAVSAE